MAEVTRKVDLPVEPEELWQVIGDAEELVAWLAEDGDLELHPGADGWLRESGVLRHVVVTSVEDGARIAFRWWEVDVDGVGPGSDVELRVAEEVAVGSRLVITETPATTALPPTAASGPVALAGVR